MTLTNVKEIPEEVESRGRNRLNTGQLVKRILIGTPLPWHREKEERLPKILALAVFASDAISSNAYATEAIMLVLVLMGTRALNLTLPIGLMIAGLVTLVIFSYTQTIQHYPKGGGAYFVAKDNLGEKPALVAGAAILTDYVLTVAVSVSAGVKAITSAFPELEYYKIVAAIAVVLIIMIINLRGLKESGIIFAIPTYAFVIGILTVIFIGGLRYFHILSPLPVEHHEITSSTLAGFAYWWLLLRAFAAGCTALTGIEAISDGVGAFKEPEAKNAIKTMIAMGLIAMTLFIGISFFASIIHIVPNPDESILSQLTREVVGVGPFYYIVQFFTTMILILAANTGFQDFPRLCSFLAKDNYLPRWVRNRGDKLVYSAGIILLTGLSSIVIIIFQAEEQHMLHLYAIGVFISFTLSMAGMVSLFRQIGRLKDDETHKLGNTEIHFERYWWIKILISGSGAILSGTVLLVLTATKFLEGAWIVLVLIGLLVWLFLQANKHYKCVAATLRLNGSEIELLDPGPHAILLVGDINKLTLHALNHARHLYKQVTVLFVATDEESFQNFEKKWQKYILGTGKDKGVTKEILFYDYRDIINPIILYIQAHARIQNAQRKTLSVIVPEFVAETPAGSFLHNGTARTVTNRLKHLEEVIIITEVAHLVRS